MTKTYNWVVPVLSIIMFSNVHVLQIGREIVVASGLVGGLLIVFSCCYIFYFISSIIVKTVVNSKRGIFQSVEEYFGRGGAIFCMVLVVAVFCAWFIIQFRFLMDSVLYLFSIHNPLPLALFQSFLLYLLIVSSISVWRIGFFFCSGLFTLINITSVLCITYALFTKISLSNVRLYANSFELHTTLPLLNNLLTAIFAIPIFYKSNIVYRNTKFNLKLIYFVFLPFLVGVGVLFGFLGPESPNFVHFCLSQPGLLRTIIPAYLLSSMCFINILNLYFASGFITYITNTEGRILPTLIAMVLCVALFFIQNLEDLLSPLVASIASIITIIVTKFTIKQYQDSNEFRRDNMISLLISLVILFLCKMGWIKITGILFFDAVIVALIFSIHTYKIVRSKK